VLQNLRFWSKHPLILLKALGFTLIHQAAIYLIIRVLIEGMGETLSFWQIAGIWSLTYFISLLPISINGLGLQEITITNLYTLFGGLSPATSIALALILRLVWLFGSLPGALFIGEVWPANSPARWKSHFLRKRYEPRRDPKISAPLLLLLGAACVWFLWESRYVRISGSWQCCMALVCAILFFLTWKLKQVLSKRFISKE
jgi:hypothetical protein